MKQTLADLWYGNIHPMTDGDLEVKNEEELESYLDRHFQYLESHLDEKGKEILKKFTDCYDELMLNRCEYAFSQGFTLAAKLLTESLT